MDANTERVYGVKARMALMVPSTNTVAETEFWKMAPEGLTVHTSRMPFFADRFDSPFDEMESHLSRVIDEVNSAQPDIIAYGCTASSAKGNPIDYEKQLTQNTGKPTVTAAAALVEALKTFSAKKIVMITPYPQSTNDKERVFFQGNGVEVIEDESIIIDDAQLKFKNMNKIPTDLLIDRSVSLGQAENVDAVILSCCDMPTLNAIPIIEDAIGKPVTSSTQALFWRAIRTAGILDPIEGVGSLLIRT
ncbi:MAG: aspartate/glutamate racemase family protein [Alphaproteobacteria bacterium]|nr:aspartate/glutamate racemase family protein [Alphaproteobacteria bacterium]